MSEIFVTSAKRTAVGSLGKSLKNISAEELGSAVISENLKNLKISKDDVDEIIAIERTDLAEDALVGVVVPAAAAPSTAGSPANPGRL